MLNQAWVSSVTSVTESPEISAIGVGDGLMPLPKPKFIICGVSGKIGTGKDYVTNHYFKPYGFKQFSWAFHLKIGVVGKGLATYDEVFYSKPPHVRNLLQQEGTERGRMVYGENVWIDTAYAWLTLLNEMYGFDRFIIPDVRFKNECKAIQSWGGKVVRVHAPQRNAKQNLSDAARAHSSETDLDDYPNFDFILNNDIGFEHTVKDQVHTFLMQNNWMNISPTTLPVPMSNK